MPSMPLGSTFSLENRAVTEIYNFNIYCQTQVNLVKYPWLITGNVNVIVTEGNPFIRTPTFCFKNAGAYPAHSIYGEFWRYKNDFS